MVHAPAKEFTVEDKVACGFWRKCCAHYAYRRFNKREHEEPERKNCKRVECDAFAHTEYRKTGEQGPPKCGERFCKPPVRMYMSAPEDQYEDHSDDTELYCLSEVLRGQHYDSGDKRPAYCEQKAAHAGDLIYLLEEYRKDPDPKRADSYRSEVREVVVLALGKFNEGYPWPEERKSEADYEIEEAEIFSLCDFLAESNTCRSDTRRDRYPERPVRRPYPAESPCGDQGNILEVIILVALKVFFEESLYEYAYDCYKQHEQDCQCVIAVKHQ